MMAKQARPGAFSDDVDAGSSQKMRSTKERDRQRGKVCAVGNPCLVFHHGAGAVCRLVRQVRGATQART